MARAVVKAAREFAGANVELDKANQVVEDATKARAVAAREFERAKRTALHLKHVGLVTYRGIVVRFTSDDVQVITPISADADDSEPEAAR